MAATGINTEGVHLMLHAVLCVLGDTFMGVDETLKKSSNTSRQKKKVLQRLLANDVMVDHLFA